MKKKKSAGQILIEFENEEQYKRLKRRDYYLKTKYGITQEKYEDIKEFQENCCGICKQKCDDLVVDHDHGSGALRGLLCHSCNVMLGHAKDNLQTLKYAIEYLENHRTLYCKPCEFKIKTVKNSFNNIAVVFYKDKKKIVEYESHKGFYKHSVFKFSPSGLN